MIRTDIICRLLPTDRIIGGVTHPPTPPRSLRPWSHSPDLQLVVRVHPSSTYAGGGEGRGYSWCVYISANFALHNVNLPLTSTVLFSLSINNTCIDDSKSSQLCSTDFKTCSGCSGKSLVSSSMCSCDVDTAGPLSELLFLGDIVAVGLQTSALSYTTKMKETYCFIRILTKPRKTTPQCSTPVEIQV